MKTIVKISLAIILFVTACVPKFEDEFEYPDNAEITRLLVGNRNGMIPIETVKYDSQNLDSIFLRDRTADLSDLFLRATIARGVNIEPLEGAPKFGTYGDFSSPRKYRITAPSGKSVERTYAFGFYIPPVGCLADRWVGNVDCRDGIWPSYSPASAMGEKLNNDCHRVKLTFNFWDDAGAKAEMELLLGQIDYDTFRGPITLVNDVSVTSWGSTMTFHKGAAGTYNATANTLNLEINFSGYNLPGGATKYKFTVSQKN
jgi:hypothetical protein